MSGPHEPRKSMYVRPSTSVMRQPSPRSTKKGRPPTPRKARTGLLTPPGMIRWAVAKSSSELECVMRLDSFFWLLPVDGEKVSLRRVPAERSRFRHAALPNRDHHIGGVRVRGLAVDHGVVLVGRREVGARVDVGVVDGQHAKPLG